MGESAGLLEVRRAIARVTYLPVPVLIRGQTGTGKEVVARALHENSPRRDRPFVSVNLGALAPSLAAAELFGARKGAFTGAVRDQPGFFGRADGGTLLLDEIGEATPEVQVMLLRTLETGEVLAIGSQTPRRQPGRSDTWSRRYTHAWLAFQQGEIAEAPRRRGLGALPEVLAPLDEHSEASAWQELSTRAQAVAHLDRRRGAVTAAQEALRLAPGSGQAAFEAALVNTLVGDRTAALVNAERAITLGFSPRFFELPWFDALRTEPGFTALISPAHRSRSADRRTAAR